MNIISLDLISIKKSVTIELIQIPQYDFTPKRKEGKALSEEWLKDFKLLTYYFLCDII